MAERLLVRGLRRSYGARVVLEEISFAAAPGEMLALLGLSGCGKSTTLRAIAGLDRPDGGQIEISGRTVFGPGVFVPPHRRNVGLVFQGQMLWPHLGVAEHLDFVLRARGVPAAERKERVKCQLEAVRLTGRDASRPAELSGGEAQRLAIARALVGRPELLLLDEPCANLDAPLKRELLALLSGLRAGEKFSGVYVTHDAAEAFELASRVAVLDGGRVVQSGTPRELSLEPATAAVARIIGGGALLAGEIEAEKLVKTALGTLRVEEWPEGASPGRKVRVFLRTEELRVDSAGPLEASVRGAHYDGRGWMVRIEAGGTALRARADSAVREGERVRLSLLRPPRLFLDE